MQRSSADLNHFDEQTMIDSPSAQIAIIGAGPAGLYAAERLRAQGFRRITVFERSHRVGGMCASVTEDGDSFDLGATLLTADYDLTRRLAAKYGFRFRDAGEAVQIEATTAAIGDLPEYVFGGRSPVHKLDEIAHYLRLRLKLGAVVDKCGWRDVHNNPDLTIPTSTWLTKHDLEALTEMFEACLFSMGYGHLSSIPVLYALPFC